MKKQLERRVVSLEAARGARATKGPTEAELMALLQGRFAAYERRELDLARMSPTSRAEALRAELIARRAKWAEDLARPNTGRLSAHTPALERRMQQELELRILKAEGEPLASLELQRRKMDELFSGGGSRARTCAR